MGIQLHNFSQTHISTKYRDRQLQDKWADPMIVSCDRQRVADIAANSGSCAMRASVWGKGRVWPEEGEDEEMH